MSRPRRLRLRRPRLCRVRLFVFGIPLLLGVSGLAYAYFTSQGGGAGAVATGSLAIPVMNTATPGAGMVTLTWGAVPPPATGSVNYFVTANGGTPPGGTCGSPGSPIAATTCTVTGLSAGNNSFTVTAAWNSFTSTSAPPTAVTLTSGAATTLAFSIQPTVGQNIQATGTGTFSASVSIQDANANTVTTATNAVTLAIGTNPSAGVLACTNTGGLTVTSVSGVATFTGCSITKAGSGYTLAATSSPVLTPPVNANAFNIIAGAASQLVFTTQPVAGVPLGTNFATSPKVSVEDANGNVVTSDTGTVTLAIASGPGGASLSCSNPGFPTIAAVAGVATFTNCQINGTLAAGTYALSATRGGLTTALSGNVVINAGTATNLAFTTQPTVGQNIQAKGTGTFSASVTVQDANGNTVTATNAVTLAIGTNPSGGVLACTNSGGLTTNAVSGVATFTGCSITKAGTGYTLAAASSPVLTPPVNANAFNITAGGASQLVFTTQPVGGVPVGTNFATSPKVSVEDTNGNVVTSDTGTVTLAIASGPGGASLSCSNPGFPTIAAVAGVATFTNCQIGGTAGPGTYTLQATRGGLTTALSGNVVINAGTATNLAFTTQPTVGQNIQAKGTGTFSASVTVQDANGNTVTATNAVTLAIGTNPSGGVLACTNSGGLTTNAVSGVATFTGCSITKAGTGYTLAAASSPVLTPPVNANAFNITAGGASQLVFTTQPVGGVPVGTNFATSPKVSVEDTNGNVVTSDTGTVTLAIASGPGGASLSCSNPGFPTIAAVAGVATFTNCQIGGTAGPGTYTLQATRGGLTTALSGNVVINAGTATNLAFTTQPTVGQNIQAKGTGTFSASVTVQDANGNTVTATNAVTLAIGTNPSGGVLACTNSGGLTTNAVSGVATFTGCSITKAGTGYTLAAASSPVLTPPVNANAFNITAGGASQLVFTTQPVGGVPVGTNFATSPKVSVEDTNGNVVTSDTGTVTLAIASGPGGASLSCSNPGFPTIAAVAGVATFTNCQIGGTAGPGTYTLQATRGGLTTALSGNVVINAGTATNLAFTTQPTVGQNIQAKGTGTFSASVTVQD